MPQPDKFTKGLFIIYLSLMVVCHYRICILHRFLAIAFNLKLDVVNVLQLSFILIVFPLIAFNLKLDVVHVLQLSFILIVFPLIIYMQGTKICCYMP